MLAQNGSLISKNQLALLVFKNPGLARGFFMNHAASVIGRRYEDSLCSGLTVH